MQILRFAVTVYVALLKQTFLSSCISQSKQYRDAFSEDEIRRLRKPGAKAFLSVVSWSYG